MDFYGKRKIFYAISLALIVVGVIAIIINNGFVLDIQFQGGAVVEIAVPHDNYDLEDIQETLSSELDKVVNAQKSFYEFDISAENADAWEETYNLDIRIETGAKLTEEEVNSIESYLAGRYGDEIMLDEPAYHENHAPYAAVFKVRIPSDKITGEEGFKEEVGTVENDLKSILEKKVSTDFSYIYNPSNEKIVKHILNLKIPSKNTMITQDELYLVKKIVSEKLDFVVSENSATGDFNLSTVSPTVGQELTRNSIMALAATCVLILIYVWFRFKRISGLSAGFASLTALAFDALSMVFIYAIVRFPVNESFIAAILTILGYSINDTIVIFDRIRENQAKHKNLKPGEVANISITQSLTRSINTALCTLISLVVLYVFARIYKLTSMEQFSFPLIIGMITGCYSSIFLAAPLWAAWQHKKQDLDDDKKAVKN